MLKRRSVETKWLEQFLILWHGGLVAFGGWSGWKASKGWSHLNQVLKMWLVEKRHVQYFECTSCFISDSCSVFREGIFKKRCFSSTLATPLLFVHTNVISGDEFLLSKCVLWLPLNSIVTWTYPSRSGTSALSLSKSAPARMLPLFNPMRIFSSWVCPKDTLGLASCSFCIIRYVFLRHIATSGWWVTSNKPLYM